MDSQGIHVMTIANSIIGVSIIAMPYCFKQCGIILSILMLIISSIISRLSCHFLLKSAIKARLRTFEFLAYHAFGSLGKFVVEIGMIGFLLGTCIAFFVVMGDLGPEIVAQMIGIKNSDTLRSSILFALAVFCVLPLGLLRNVDSLSGVCVATVGFYVCLVLKIIAESASHIINGDWYQKVDLWRTEGVLQCIPIFSIALFCQTQLFEIYQAIPNASLDRMNALIRMAVNICTCVYVFVGAFGYIALSDQAFTGNVLLSLEPSFLTEIIKIGFVLSLAFSFPLIIFPCRASLFSLIYKPTFTALHDGGTHFIPETKFRALTVFIIAISLSIGILIPNIELVLGLVGSTIGVSICVLFPATCFICMVKKNTSERILAQIMLCIGIIVMVLGTYANLNVVDEMTISSVSEHPLVKVEILKTAKDEKKVVFDIPTTEKLAVPSVNFEESKKAVEDDVLKEIRHEPPQPVAPLEHVQESQVKEIKQENIPKQLEIQPNELELKEIRHEPPQPIEPEHNINQIKQDESQAKQFEKKADDKYLNVNIPDNHLTLGKQSQEKIMSEGNSIGEQVDAEAIKKEEKEISQQAQEDLKNVFQKLDLISELQKQNQVQQQHIVEQQKQIWEEMKQRKNIAQEQIQIDKVKQEKLKAVEEIQYIAKKAIESLVDDDPKILLDSKIKPNQYDKPKSIDLNVNMTFKTSRNVKVKPSLLSQRLEQNIVNNTNLTLVKNEKFVPDEFIPLPIIKSNMLTANNSNNTAYNSYGIHDGIIRKNESFIKQINSTDESQNKTIEVNLFSQKILNITSKTFDQNTQNLISKESSTNNYLENKHDIHDIKSMRRDILSESLGNIRNKREVSDNSNDHKNDDQCEQNKIEQEESSEGENKAPILLNNLQHSENSTVDENCDKL